MAFALVDVPVACNLSVRSSFIGRRQPFDQAHGDQPGLDVPRSWPKGPAAALRHAAPRHRRSGPGGHL